jgi:hypothetical protein
MEQVAPCPSDCFVGVLLMRTVIAQSTICIMAIGLLLTVTAFAGRPARHERAGAQLAGARVKQEAVGQTKPVGPRIQAAIEKARQTDEATVRASREGKKVMPQRGVTGQLLALHQEIGRAFEAQAPLPAERIAHFGWVLRQNPPLEIVGWRGVVNSVASHKNGLRVSVTFSPRFVGPGIAFTRDHYVETYDYVGGQLIYVGGSGPPAGMFDGVMID